MPIGKPRSAAVSSEARVSSTVAGRNARRSSATGRLELNDYLLSSVYGVRLNA
jgi:hypothetical protein